MSTVLWCAGFFILGVTVGSVTMCLLNMSHISKQIFFELVFMDDELYRNLQQAVKREKEKMGMIRGRD